ncbi:MAG: DNA primase, partial [Scardovia wiggsiae]
LIQSPLSMLAAPNKDLYGRLSERCFLTPVFRTLYNGLQVAGGLPERDMPQGLWIHNLTKACGPMMEQVISELAVQPLPLSAKGRSPSADENSPAALNNAGDTARPGGESVQLRAATEIEIKFAGQLLTRLLDADALRAIARMKRKMAKLPEGEEKVSLLNKVVAIEAWRKELTAQAYGNIDY